MTSHSFDVVRKRSHGNVHRLVYPGIKDNGRDPTIRRDEERGCRSAFEEQVVVHVDCEGEQQASLFRQQQYSWTSSQFEIKRPVLRHDIRPLPGQLRNWVSCRLAAVRVRSNGHLPTLGYCCG